MVWQISRVVAVRFDSMSESPEAFDAASENRLGDRLESATDDRSDEFRFEAVPSDFKKRYDLAPTDEPWFDRLRVFFWNEHQPAIAAGLALILAGMGLYFVVQSFSQRGLVDIDQVASLEAAFQVDINSAKLGEIVLLPGVGRKLAQAILDWRGAHGPFESLNSLGDVPGIGEKKLEAMAPFLLPISKWADLAPGD